MRKEIKDIIETLKYHTKLLESLCEGESARINVAANAKKQADAFIKVFTEHPSIKSNPEALDFFKTIMNAAGMGTEKDKGGP